MKEEIQNFIQIAQNGHYDLFHPECIYRSLKSKKKYKSKTSYHKIQDIFKTLNKHKSITRKKTLLYSLSENERDEFIRSFFRVVEDKVLDKTKYLQ